MNNRRSIVLIAIVVLSALAVLFYERASRIPVNAPTIEMKVQEGGEWTSTFNLLQSEVDSYLVYDSRTGEPMVAVELSEKISGDLQGLVRQNDVVRVGLFMNSQVISFLEINGETSLDEVVIANDFSESEARSLRDAIRGYRSSVFWSE